MSQDWITGYLALTEGLPTPPSFRLWSAISAIGAAMERRAWAMFNLNTLYPNLFTILVGGPSVGKCLHPDELILTADGNTMRAGDVYPGLLLQGPTDPRTVQEVHRGDGQLYRIVPLRGRSWVCNGLHILTLRKSKNPHRGSFCEVSVEDYIHWPAAKKAKWKLWRAPVRKFIYREKPEVDPYLLGVLLGDGDSLTGKNGVTVTTVDPEIRAMLQEQATLWNLELSYFSYKRIGLISRSWQDNPLLTQLRLCGLDNVRCEEKFVPAEFKCGSWETRRQILAGLMDTDGSLSRERHYDFISKSKNLAEDVAFLARSLGLAAFVSKAIKYCVWNGEKHYGTYWRVYISGDLSLIPCRIARKKSKHAPSKNVLNVGFSVQPCGHGPWIGFSVDGDNLFMLDDFTVLHNSQSISPVRSILAESRSVLLSPDDMTKAALVDTLVESKRRVILARGEPPVTYHSLCITATEFGTLISAHDVEFLNTLNKLYDCEPTYSSRRRGHNEGKVINIDKPGVSILAGTQPGYLGDLLPESAWIMGFTSRLILVYASGRAPIDPFAQPEDRGPLKAELVQKLQAISRLVGPFRVEPDVQRAFKSWVFAGLPPVPQHTRLANYVGRRDIHVMKLAMIAAAAARCELRVTIEDYERAKSWLLAAERDMPDIFRDMHMKNDNILMIECHRYVMELWTKSAREVAARAPVHRAKIFEFMQTRCPVEKAQKVLEIMCLSNWLAPVEGSGGLLYVPKARMFGQIGE